MTCVAVVCLSSQWEGTASRRRPPVPSAHASSPPSQNTRPGAPTAAQRSASFPPTASQKLPSTSHRSGHRTSLVLWVRHNGTGSSAASW